MFSHTKTTGQLEDLGEVEALEEVGLVRRAVAEVRDRDAARAAEREPGARGGGDAAADDAVAAEDAVLRVDDVHRAGETAVDAGLAAEQLCEQGLGVDAHRERVAVAAVRARDPVVRPEQAGDPDRDRLLPE